MRAISFPNAFTNGKYTDLERAALPQKTPELHCVELCIILIHITCIKLL